MNEELLPSISIMTMTVADGSRERQPTISQQMTMTMVFWGFLDETVTLIIKQSFAMNAKS